MRTLCSNETWDRLRKAAYAQAEYKCEVCGGKGPGHPVECHEIWHYDDENLIQTLIGLQALCPSCHEVKHMGLAESRGRGESAREHLARVNEWSSEDVGYYLEDAFEKHAARSTKTWTTKLTFLEANGVPLTLRNSNNQ